LLIESSSFLVQKIIILKEPRPVAPDTSQTVANWLVHSAEILHSTRAAQTVDTEHQKGPKRPSQ
jgi:hypothetical protein